MGSSLPGFLSTKAWYVRRSLPGTQEPFLFLPIYTWLKQIQQKTLCLLSPIYFIYKEICYTVDQNDIFALRTATEKWCVQMAIQELAPLATCTQTTDMDATYQTLRSLSILKGYSIFISFPCIRDLVLVSAYLQPTNSCQKQWILVSLDEILTSCTMVQSHTVLSVTSYKAFNRCIHVKNRWYIERKSKTMLKK